MRFNYRKAAIIGILVLLVLKAVRNALDTSLTVTFTEFQKMILSQIIHKGTIYSIGEGMAKIVGITPDGQVIQTVAPFKGAYLDYVTTANQNFNFSEHIGERPDILDAMAMFLFRLLFYSFIFSLNFRSGIESHEFVFVKSTISFDDIGGLSREKKEVMEIAQMLKNRHKYIKRNISIPKGVLFFGEPGNGKTMMAKAIAHASDVLFIAVSGAEFDEIFVGMGPLKIRNLFDKARKNKPVIIFIDEIDTVGKARGIKTDTGTLNQLLCEIDGFGSADGILVIAATNMPHTLDPALTRAGRIDTHVNFNMPAFADRKEIAQLYLDKNRKNTHFVNDAEFIANMTAGFSASKINQLINLAVINAVHEDRSEVTAEHLGEALDKLLMGLESSLELNEAERQEIAVHEVGHAFIFLYFKKLGLSNKFRPYKITIRPRANALGMFMFMLDGDVTTMKKCELEARICVTLGGLAAEQIYLGKDNTTTGVSADLQQVTTTLKNMYQSYGMYADQKISAAKSGQQLSQVENKINQTIEDLLKRTVSIIKTHANAFNDMVKELLDKNDIYHDRLVEIMEKTDFQFTKSDLVSKSELERNILGNILDCKA